MGVRGEVKPVATARAVFLDRDGVVNRALVRNGKPYPPASLAELEVLPGVGEALSRLKAAGLWLIVTTNQPDVARGTQTREQVEALHVALKAQLPIDEFRTCYHDAADACACRKPRPGLLLQAARDHQIELSHSYMVGDRWRDVAAGQYAGCTSLFIDYHYAEREPGGSFVRIQSLLEAAEWILTRGEKENRG
jgi:D-glycero-D-manno-heptose 1,7-bisphosphate phosphatase